MRLLILGATGATGQHLLEQALAEGHEVTAIVRDPSKVTTKHERLRVVKGRANKIARKDVAAFMLKELASGTHAGQMPLLWT